MDRAIVYPSALPQDVDILNTNKFGLFGLAYALHGILGTATVVEGLACTPTTPTPDLNVHISVGSIYTLADADASAYGSLGTDSSLIVKQGIINTSTSLAITPPATGGFSQVYLVQVIYDDVDAGSQVLSYFNAANPAVPFSGPANSGMSQFSKRTGICSIALKAGVPATTGTQTTPAPDAGYTGLYAITVANGQTQITSSNIVQLTTAPFFPTLPAIPGDVQNNIWTYCVDTSTGGAPFATNGSTTTSSATLNFASVPAWVTVGMKAFDLSTPTAITGGQTVLSKTSTTVVLSANVNATVSNGDTIAFSNNAFAASVTPAPVALTPGMGVLCKLNSTNTSQATFNLNGLGAVAIHRANTAVLSPGDVNYSMIVAMVYDGTAWQVMNFEGFTSTTVNNNTSIISIPYATDSSAVANTVVASPSPAIGSYSAGYTIEVKIANTNTGASTLSVSGVGAVGITNSAGNPLLPSQLVAGHIGLFVHNGTTFDLINNGALTLQANQNWYVNASTGSDTLYDGTSPTVSGNHGPFATIQKAVNTTELYNMNGYNQTINVANGTYTGGVIGNFTNGSGTVNIIGNVGNPSLCQMITSGASIVSGFSFFQGSWSLSGFRIECNNTTFTGDPGYGVVIQAPGFLSISNLQFGYCVGGHIQAENGAFLQILPGNINIESSPFQQPFHMNAATGATIKTSFINADKPSLVILGAVNFGTFLTATLNGTFNEGTYQSIANASFVTGYRYSADTNGVISTGGLGAAYYPGSIPGITSSGGQYV